MKDNGHGIFRAVWRAAFGSLIALAAWGGVTGSATAQVTNDNFADALPLTGYFGTTNADTTGYTPEIGEPSHAGFPASASAWFKWTAPVSGEVQFDTFGSSNNTVLAVYTGTQVGKLDFVVANDDATPLGQSAVGAWNGPSLVKFNAKGGQTYFIAVDAYLYYTYINGVLSILPGSGPITLSWAYHSAGVFRFTADAVGVSETDSSPPVQSGNTAWSAEGARVTVTRVAGSSGRATVDLSATAGSATNGVDYSFIPTRLVFNDWEMSKSVVIPLFHNISFSNRLFSVVLSNPQLDPLESTAIQPPRLDPDHYTQTITNLNYDLDRADTNNPAAASGIVNFARSTYRTLEDIGTVTVHVTIQGDARPRSISWRIDKTGRGGPILRDNTFGLQAGSDYATPDPVSSIEPSDDPVDFRNSPDANDEEYGGTFVWNPGDSGPKAINIPINNDTFPEFNEDIKLRIFNSGRTDSAEPGEVSETTITILHDDYPAGALDTSHNRDFSLETEPVQNSTPGADETVYASALQADGKCIIAGDFTSYDAVSRNRIARMNVDGSNDGNFNPGSGANDFISTMALGTGGKILIGGGFTSFNGQLRSRVARLNGDGSLDASFNPGLGADNTVWSVVRQDDGKVLIGGEFTSVNGFGRPYIARLNSDGSVDETFVTTNALNGPVEAIAVTPDGTIYVAGTFTMAGGISRNRIARLHADGSLDLTFDPRTGVDGPVYALALQLDGRLLLGGDFNTVDFRARQNLARLNPDGMLDTNFDPGSGVDDTVYAITLQNDGRIFIGGAFLHVNGTRRVGVARLFANGRVDTSFMDMAYNHYAGIPTHYSTEIENPAEPRNFLLTLAVQDDGNLIIGGSFHQVGGGRLHTLIQTNDFDFTHVRYDEYLDGTYGYSRQAYRNRYNVARLLGGETDGPGNIGFLDSTYSIDETAGYVFITTLRENGTLGPAETTFSLTKRPEGSAVAETTTDYSYNHINPFYDTSWSGTRNLADGIYGQNNVGIEVTPNTTVITFTDDIYVTIPHRQGIEGDRMAQLQLDVPSQADVFYLGGENVPLCAALGRTSATLQINDADKTPGVIGFSAAGYTVNENGTNAVITLTRTNGSDGLVSVSFSTENGTAINGVNYTGQTNTITFGQGVTNRTLLIPILNNSTIQNDDLTVQLLLKSPANGATLGLSNAVLSIIDEDFPFGRINFTTTATQTNEYAGNARVTVTRTGGNLGVLDVQCLTVNGTAIHGVNYVGQTNTFHWDSLDTTPRYLDIPILPDALVTPDLNFSVRLSNPTIPGALGARTNIVVTIANEDFYGSPQFSAATYYVDETAGYATINVVRVGGSAQTVSVNYSTSDGTAVSGGALPNYGATSGTLVFGPGVASRSFTVPILNDGVVNSSPFFFAVTLSGLTPAGSTLGSPVTAQVLIKDAQSFTEPPGSLDPTFDAGIGFNGDVYALARQTNGSIVVGGGFTTVNGLSRSRLARVSANGAEDTGFLSGLSGPNGTVRAVISQTDARLLVGGQFTTVNGVNRNYITRLNTDGSIDTTFDPGSGADAPVYALREAFMLNGARKLYVGGSFGTFNGVASPGLVRLNDNGTVDNTFNIGVGVNGLVYSVAVYPTNTIQAGKVLIGGAFTMVNGVARANIARLNPDGSLDTSFNPGSGANAEVRSVVLQPDGKVLLGGLFTTVNGTALSRIARLNVDGSVDGSFNVGAGANDSVYTLALQADNRILVAGDFSEASGVTRRRITRLLPDGTVDPTINFGSGANGFINALVVQPDGNVVLGGGFTTFRGETANRIARIFGGSMTGAGQIEFTAASYVVNEDGTNALVTLRRIGGTTGTAALTFQTLDNSAVAGVNYTAVNQVVSFAEGEVETSVLVPVQQDYQITSDLLAILYLSGSAELLGPQPIAFLQIRNVDSTVHFSAATYTRNEDAIDGVATITLVREGSTLGSATVDFMTTTNGTAVAGVNYEPLTNTVVFLPGEASQTVRIPVLHNPVAEGDRTVTMALSTPMNTVLLSPDQAVLTIRDVDQAPGQLTFSAPSFVANEAATNAVITVLRTNGTTGIVSINIATVPGTATPGSRYVATNGVLTFTDGQDSRTFLIPVINDNIVQGDQSLTIQLSNPTGGSSIYGPSTAPLTIVDDDVAVNFTSPSYVVDETAGLVNIGVQRLNGSNGITTVNFKTMDGTAVAGTNYTANNRTLTFNPGETLKTVSVAVQRDPRVTGNLSFSVLLTNVTAGVQLVPPNPATVIIVDSDPGLSLTNSTYTVLESATNLLVTVVRSNANSGDVTVNYTTADGTAVAGQDYTFTSGMLAFSNGVTERTITIPILNNQVPEGDRTFDISLFNPTGGAQLLSPSSATATIVDDDAGLRFSTDLYRAVESGVTATITVQRTSYTNSTVRVDYATQDGTGVAGTDYTPASGTLTFTNGETTKTFTVGLHDDSVLNGDRTVLLKLFNVTSNAALVPPSAATLYISDDDGSLIIPAGTALVAETNSNGVIDPGETVTILFGFRNSGGTNAQNLSATLLATNGVTPVTTNQNYGPMVVGAPVTSRSFTFTANATNGQVIMPTFALADNGAPIGTGQFTFRVGTTTSSFTNGAVITITDRGSSNAPVGATPYPSTINVGSFDGVVSKVSVTFSNYSHLSAGDVGALLVSPAGQKTLLMENAGGFNTLNSLWLKFDDAASNSLPLGSVFASGAYKPTSYAPLAPFPAPAPQTGYSNTLAAFNGSNPNGTWSLFVMDDTSPGAGAISNGWALNIAKATPVPANADLSLAQTAVPSPGIAGEPLTFTLRLTNNGPATATGTTVTNTLPAGAQFVSATTAKGTATNQSGVVTWSVGTLANGATASLTLVIIPPAIGSITNTAIASSSATDVFTDNNTSTLVATVNVPQADLVLSMADSPDPVAAGWPLTYLITVTNLGPATATNVTVTNKLPAGLNFTSVTGSQGTAGHSAGTVWASLGTIASGDSATVTLVTWAAQAGTVTNAATATCPVTDPLKANNSASVKTTVLPQLVVQANGSFITISTPGLSGAVLDYTTNLNSPVVWVPLLTNPPAVVNLPITNGNRFFRLRSLAP